MLVRRQEVQGADCKEVEWPFCYRWSAAVRSDVSELSRFIVDTDTPSGVVVEGLAGGERLGVVLWREGMIAGDEGRLVASVVEAATGGGEDVVLWSEVVGREIGGAVAHLGKDRFEVCWVEGQTAEAGERIVCQVLGGEGERGGGV